MYSLLYVVEKAMRDIYKTIIEKLEKHPRSLRELSEITGQTECGLRGRIAELRKKYGYSIESIKPSDIENHYHLISKPDTELSKNTDKLIKYMESNCLYGRIINYEMISRRTLLSNDEIEDVLSRLINGNDFKVTQFSQKTITIFKMGK